MYSLIGICIVIFAITEIIGIAWDKYAKANKRKGTSS
jgi:hypothetical protein